MLLRLLENCVEGWLVDELTDEDFCRQSDRGDIRSYTVLALKVDYETAKDPSEHVLVHAAEV